ncbi:MAG: aspartate/glutamate racemase [Alphaproteobacteria bacterium PA2]|nr:MAG: aspartate/glutamate racemase [Alphaproteobacteria bacterium PA2]
MRTLGLLGGMSAESTTYYYQTLNRLVRERLGPMHSAEVVIWSIDFAPMAELQARGNWDAAGAELVKVAQALERAGAEALMIGANTMHVCAPQVEAAVGIPLIHIADATGGAIKALGCSKPLLLGTRYTMEMGFYTDRLAAMGISASVPDADDRARLHAIIYDELVQGLVTEVSKTEVLAMIARSVEADSVIFGCTEIGLLISPEDLALPVVDTAIVHAEAGVAFSMGV